MLTAVFFTLILLALLVVLSGFSDAIRHICGSSPRHRAARRLSQPDLASARFA